MAFYIRYPSSASSANPSVGINGATAPTSSTEIGFIDGSGNLQGVSATNPLPSVITGTVPLPTGAATSANQTNGNQLSRITDGTNTAAVKAASTAPIATDPALVIALSPNSPAAKAPVNLNGSGSAAAATVSTVTTLTAPSNAVGFVLMSLDTSTANIRWSIGRTASATLGQQLQPARDTGFVPCGANVSICAESGTQNYDIQWVSQ